MKKLKFLTIIMFLSMLLVNKEGFSQLKYSFAFEYSTAFNTAQAADYISDPSFQGFSGSFKAFTPKKLVYGMEIGWNVFSQSTTSTTVFPSGAISGYQGRYYTYVPVLANIGYAFQNKRNSKLVPYISANVGAFYIEQEFQVGVSTLNEDGWNFGFGPELGLIYKVGNGVGITFNGKYNFALSNGGTAYTNTTVGDNDFSFFNLNLGISYIQ